MSCFSGFWRPCFSNWGCLYRRNRIGCPSPGQALTSGGNAQSIRIHVTPRPPEDPIAPHSAARRPRYEFLFSLQGASDTGSADKPPLFKGRNARIFFHGPLVGPAGKTAGQKCRPKMPAKTAGKKCRPKMSAKTCRHEPAPVFHAACPDWPLRVEAGGPVGLGPRPSLQHRVPRLAVVLGAGGGVG